MKLFNKLGLAVVLATPALAFAAIDITELTDVLVDIAAVGAAVFAIGVGVKLFKWARAAL